MIASILFGLATVVRMVLNMAMVCVFLSILITLLNADPYNPYVRMINAITEPLSRPLRRFTRRLNTPIDFSQVLLILIIIFLLEVVPRYLLVLAQQFS